MVDKDGLSYARKAIIMTGLSLGIIAFGMSQSYQMTFKQLSLSIACILMFFQWNLRISRLKVSVRTVMTRAATNALRKTIWIYVGIDS